MQYTYSITTDFVGLTESSIDVPSLKTAIQNSAIVTAYDYTNISGDAVDIFFKDTLSAGDETILDGLVAAHTGVPATEPSQTVNIGNTLNLSPNTQVNTFPAKGDSPIIVSHNFCDPKSWYTNSQLVTGSILLADAPGIQYSFPANHNLIDVETGRISKSAKLYNKTTYNPFDPASWRPLYLPKIYVNDVLQSESAYKVTYVDGTGPNQKDFITFNTPININDVVKADYYHATDAMFRLKPDPGKILSIKMVELQFSINIAIHNRNISFLTFVPNPYAGYALMQYGPGEIYKNVKNYEDESNNDRTRVLPPVGELRNERLVWIWDYQTLTELKSSQGAEIRIIVDDRKGNFDNPFMEMSTAQDTYGQDTTKRGEYATATFHCVVETDPNYPT